MARRDRLDEYRRKRNFSRTSEPSGGKRRRGGRRFVVQKHDASRLHYDFRLQVNNVLVSWAVPKGPSLNPRDKRLAVQTEDHPLGYADFEGVIPESEYGGGTVMVWDQGTYRNLRANKGRHSIGMDTALDEGLVEVLLEGEKLKGGFALKRFREGRKPQWLLIKMDDEHADARRNPTSTQTRSAKSGRAMREIAREEQPRSDGRGRQS